MPIPITDQVTSFDEGNIAILQKILDEIRSLTPAIRYSTSAPTTATIQLHEMVVMDNGSGTKRLYFKTAQGNLGYTTLT